MTIRRRPADGNDNGQNPPGSKTQPADIKPDPDLQEPKYQKPVYPEMTATWRYIRIALLWTYFWTSVFVLAMTQYVGLPLYLINRDYYYRYMSFTKEGMALLVLTMTQWWTSTKVYVSGDDSVKDQIRVLPDGTVECKFAERMVLIANHQMYNDWVYLWHTAYTARTHGWVYIVLKNSISYIPIIGTGLRMAGFVFMSRNMATDRPRLQHRLAQLTQHSPSRGGKLNPMWLLMFPEGTNLSKNGRAASARWAAKSGRGDLRYALIPRSTGTYFCLKGLEGSVEWVYDCTVAYDDIPPGQYGQDTHSLPNTYVFGRPPPIHMHWRRYHVPSIPLLTLEEFDTWLQQRWLEKDELLEHHARSGEFPSALNADEKGKGGIEGKREKGGGEIVTSVKLGSWMEIWKYFGIFTAIIVLGWALLRPVEREVHYHDNFDV